MKRVILTEFASGYGIIAPDGHVYKDNMITDDEARWFQCWMFSEIKYLLFKFSRENKNSN